MKPPGAKSLTVLVHNGSFIKLSITNVLKCSNLQTPQQILLKFSLNSFQARVIFPPILVLVRCPILEDTKRIKNNINKNGN